MTKGQVIHQQARELETLYTIRAHECSVSFYQFFIEFWDVINEDELVLNFHIKYLCDELQEIVERAIRKEPKKQDVIINIPPGTSKSTILMQMLGVWSWIHAPHLVIIFTTHSNSLSVTHSLRSKDIFNSDRWHLYFQPLIKKKFGHRLIMTKDNESEWKNNYGGMMIYTSVGSKVTGKHAHLIFWDDLIDVEDGNSTAIRKKANRYISKTIPSRKKDKAVTPTIGIMQRLHEDDATGYLLSLNPNIRLIKLPARITGDVQPIELKKHYRDGLLDPIRLSESILADQKQLLGSYDFAGQYDQEPTPLGGGDVKDAWFQFIEEYDLPRGIVWDMWIDGAYTKKTENDPTGLMIAGYHDKHKRLYVSHAKSEHMELPLLLKDIPRYADMYDLGNRSKAYAEPKASGHSIKQMINDTSDLSAVLIEGKLVGEDKRGRLSVLSPKVEAGKVFLVKGTWNDDFIGQITGFPNKTHDEYVDLLGYACDHYFGKKKIKGIKRRN